MVNSIHSDTLSNTVPVLKPDEFLPPVSRWTTWGGLILASAVSLTIGLSAVIQYNVAVKADATVRPTGELRLVQSELDGTVRHIAVAENQTVRQGEVMATLDDTKLQLQKSQMQGSIQQSELQLTQLEAQIRLVDAQIRAEADSTDRAIAINQADMHRNQREYEERQLTSQSDVAEAEVALELAQDERDRYQQLAQSGAISQRQYKEKTAAVRSAEIRLERAQAALNPSQASIAMNQAQMAQEQAKGESMLASLRKERESLAQRRSELQTQLLRDRQELAKVEQDLEKSVIRATSDGIIFKLNLINAGQVIRPGDSIAQIAPAQAPLLVRAMVPNQDIDQVAVGQAVQLRINACPYTDYGTLRGTVTTIAPDAGQESSSANTSTQTTNRTFAVTITPERSYLASGQRQCQLQLGMEASASIISQQETVLQFVLRKARLLIDV